MGRPKYNDVKFGVGKARDSGILASFKAGGATPARSPRLGNAHQEKGSSNLSQQKKIIGTVLPFLRQYPIVVLGDREFHSVKLAQWLYNKKVDFAFRQKKNTCIADDEQIYLALQDLEIKPGQAHFYENISCTKKHRLGNFNLGVYWKRKYRGKKEQKDPWYILTSLPNLELTLSFYKARWGIETLSYLVG